MVCRPPLGNPIDLSRLPRDVGSSKVAGVRTPPWQNRVFLSRLHGSAGVLTAGSSCGHFLQLFQKKCAHILKMRALCAIIWAETQYLEKKQEE